MLRSIKSSNYASYHPQKRYIRSAKKLKNIRIINKLGMRLSVFPNVYGTAADSELLARTVRINKNQNFLEIGTGCGIVTLYLSAKAKKGLATDINPHAVRNSKYNAKTLGIKNVSFVRSDIFSKVKGKFDVIIFNPPFSDYKAKGLTDRMFWDTNNEAKRKFFRQAKNHLKPHGKIYFAWADFKDLDVNLPFRLAKAEGFRITKIAKEKSREGFRFYVFEIVKK